MNREIDDVHVDLLARAQVPFPSNVVPDVFAEPLGAWWSRGSRVVLGVSLSRPDQHRWAALGETLQRGLSAHMAAVSVSLEGQGPTDAPLAWTQSVIGESSEVALNLYYRAAPHPFLEDKVIGSFAWCAVDVNVGSAWLRSLWSSSGSGLFNGCDLLLATYPSRAGLVGDGHSLSKLIRSSVAERASSWMIPLDENLGYIAGVSQETRLAAWLQGGATT